MTDSVTSRGLFTEDVPDDDLRTIAVQAVTRAVLRKWPGDPQPVMRSAELLLDMALDLGPRRAVVLAEGIDQDSYRLAHAVRSTGPCGPCEFCGTAPYGGVPTAKDLEAAAQVITSLLSPVRPPAVEVRGG